MSCDCPQLVVRNIRGKGRGVFTLDPIIKGAIIEVAPVLIFVNAYTRSKTLDRYTFDWAPGCAGLALGKASLFNHSYDPNVLYSPNLRKETITFKARRNIEPGREELTINYNWNPNDKTPVGFMVC